MLVAVTLLVSACATTGSETTDTFCKTHSPSYYTAAEIDAMTDQTAKKAASDNEYGAARCGWPRRSRGR